MNRRLWALVLTLLFTLPLALALSQNATLADDDVNFAILQGTVKFLDGTPYRGATVSIKIGGKEVTPAVITDEAGLFLRLVPAGDAVISVAGTEKTVKLVAGQQTAVAFEVKQTGVSLAVTYADKTTPQYCYVRAAYKVQDKLQENVNATQLAQGRYWFKDIPANVTAMSVILRVGTNGRESTFRRQWTFDKAEDFRALSITLDNPIPFKLLVVDAAGAPIVNATVKGTISYTMPNMQFWDIEGYPTNNNPARSPLNGNSTDANGVLNLGNWPAGKYDITLRTDEAGGPPQTIDLKPDGAVIKYALNMRPRDVTQTVFGGNGQPAPNTQVYASYSSKGKVIIAQATSDAKGIVLWKDLPPVRVIVWGNGVPAGVIPTDATTIDTVLPAPVVDNNNYRQQMLFIKLGNAGNEPFHLRYNITGTRNNSINDDFTYTPQQGDRPQFSGTSGTLFSAYIVTKTSPPRLAIINQKYFPYLDDGDSAEMTLELQSCPMLKGRFSTQTGPVQEVNQFRIVPIKISSDMTIFSQNDAISRTNLMQPVFAADGSFTAALPCAGSYRLVVDLYDESIAPIPELLLDIPAEGKTADIKLPEPFFKVPAGTEINWLTPATPKTPRRLIVAAGSNPMPVFGPKDQLLACWFRPSPDKLIFWGAADQQQRQLSLRSVAITALDKDGKPFGYNMSSALLPLLPLSGGNNTRYYSPYDSSSPGIEYFSRACSERNLIQLGPGTTINQAIWSGKYLVASGSTLTPVEIPPTGPRNISVRIDQPMDNRRMSTNRQVRIKYAGTGNLDQLRKNGSERPAMLFDGFPPDRYNGMYGWYFNTGEQTINVPAQAKTLTIYWPGVGYLKDLNLPSDDKTVLELPTWTPGPSVTGKILMPDGKPYASKPINVSPGQDPDSQLRLTTDAQGGFSIKGLMPGPLFIFTQADYYYAGWSLDVSEKGLTDISLRMSSTPVRASANDNNELWWIPDAGKPIRLPASRRSDCSVHDLSPGTGWLFNLAFSPENCTYTRTTLQSGDQGYYNPQRNSNGPALALYLPLDLQKGFPGKVSLISQDERLPFRVQYQTGWLASTLLGKYVFQFSALPPGKYKVIVNTATGDIEANVTVPTYGTSKELAYPAAGVAIPR